MIVYSIGYGALSSSQVEKAGWPQPIRKGVGSIAKNVKGQEQTANSDSTTTGARLKLAAPGTVGPDIPYPGETLNKSIPVIASTQRA